MYEYGQLALVQDEHAIQAVCDSEARCQRLGGFTWVVNYHKNTRSVVAALDRRPAAIA